MDGDWSATVYLPAGRLVYCFNVDGTPWLDPDDDERMPNGWGTEYSVRMLPKEPVPIRGGAQTSLKCGIEEAQEIVVLRPSGEVDLATLPILREPLKAAAESSRHVLVDMSGVEYMDSSGIHAMFAYQRLCQERGRRLVLAAVRSTVQRILSITELEKVVPVFPSVEAALVSLGI